MEKIISIEAIREYRRVLGSAAEFHMSRLPPDVRSIVEEYVLAVKLTYRNYLVPTYSYLSAIEIGEDNRQALWIGLALGLGTVAFLVMFPGNPRDLYDPQERLQIKRDKEAKKGAKTEAGAPKKKKKTKKVAKTTSQQQIEEAESKSLDEPTGSFATGLAALVEGESGKKEGVAGDDKEPRPSDDATKDPPLPESGLADDGKLLSDVEGDPFADSAIIAKSRKAARLFGLDEKQFQKALDNAKEEWETGVPPIDADGYANAAVWATAINHGLLLTMFFGLMWAVNRDYGNLATKFLVQVFPREAVALGLAYASAPGEEGGGSYTDGSGDLE